MTWIVLMGVQEIDEDSKLVEGLKKIRIIAKATRTLVNMNSFERSDSVVGPNAVKKVPTDVSASPSTVAAVFSGTRTTNGGEGARSKSCSELQSTTPSAARRGQTNYSSCSLDGNSATSKLRFICAEEQQQPLPTWPSPPELDSSEPPPPPPLAGVDNEFPDEKFPDYEAIDVVIPNTTDLTEQTGKAMERTDSEKSVAMSCHDQMPDEPPDCFPLSIQQQWCLCADDWIICQKWRAFRSALLRVVKHPAFEWSILIMIFGSSITLCFEDIYLEENPRLMAILRYTNLVFAVLFAIEMIIKWFALGLKYYFSSVWTALDFVIVMVSLVSVAVEDSANLSALRSLRTLRALRPLRAISRWQGMKVRFDPLKVNAPSCLVRD